VPRARVSDDATPGGLFGGQVVRKQLTPGLIPVIRGPLRQKGMVIGWNPVGVDLEVGMNKGAAGGWKMVLGNGHKYGFRLETRHALQISDAINEAVGIGIRFRRTDLHEVAMIEQADCRKGTVWK
jgi:hypothetical protein